MKICYPVTSPETSIRIMGMSGDFAENLKYLKRCGFNGVEIMIRNPALLDEDRLIKDLDDAGLEAAALGVTPMVSQDKLTIASDDANIRREAIRRGLACIDLAKRLGAPFCIGGFKGSISDSYGNTREDAKRTFSELCQYAKEQSVTILFEPQSRLKGNYLNSITEAMQWIQEIGCDNLKMILDVFHIAASGQELTEAATMAQDHYGLIHMCDEQRLVMGFGNLRLIEFVKALQEQHYSGFFSTEIKQLPDQYTAAKMTADYYRYLQEVVLDKR